MTAAYVIYIALILARVGAFVAVMPMFSTRTPKMARIGLALALTAFYVSQVSPQWDAEFARKSQQIDPIIYGLSLVREAILGAAMGFAFTLFLLPARVAGEFVTTQIGLSVSPQAGPTGDASGPLTEIFETMLGMLFLLMDGHHVLIATLHATFSAMPLGSAGIPNAAPMIVGLQSSYEMGLLLTAPLAMCLFLLAILMAVMARTAPQLNVYSVGFSLQVIVALVGALYLLPEMANSMAFIIGRVSDSLNGMLRG